MDSVNIDIPLTYLALSAVRNENEQDADAAAAASKMVGHIMLILMVFALILSVVVDMKSANSKKLHSAKYLRVRQLHWVPIAMIYSTLYLSRYCVAYINNATVLNKLNIDKVQLSSVFTSGMIVYAISGPISAQIGNIIGGRASTLYGAFGSAVSLMAVICLDYLYPNGSNPDMMILGLNILFSANMFFQGLASQCAMKLLAPWYSQTEKGLFSGLFSFWTFSAYFIGWTIGPALEKIGWVYVFFVPGCMQLFNFFLCYFLVSSGPEASGVGETEAETVVEQGYKQLPAAPTMGFEPKKDDISGRWKELLSKPVFQIYLVMAAIICAVRDGIQVWLLTYFAHLGICNTTGTMWLAPQNNFFPAPPPAEALGFTMTVGGILGGATHGWITDNVFKSSRIETLALSSACLVVCVWRLWYLTASMQPWMVTFILFCIYFFTNGSYAIISYCVNLDMGERLASNSAGAKNLVSYISTGLIGGFFFAYVITQYGYVGWMATLLGLLVLGVLTLVFGIVVNVPRK